MHIIYERKHIIKDPNRIIGRWFCQLKYMFNIGNERDGNMTGLNLREDLQHIVIEPFELVEVENQMKKMQKHKACGPDGLNVWD